MTTANVEASGSQALQEKSWPITVLVVGQAISGAWAVVLGAWSLLLFLGLGGPDNLGNSSGLGGFLTLMSAFMSGFLPLAGILRLVTALGLHRRRQWARWVALGLSVFDLGLGLMTLLQAAVLVLFHLPGLALAAFTLVVLFKKEYAAKFSSGHPRPDNLGEGV
jgi:hypothetical protein